MNKQLLFLALIFLLNACGPTPTVVPPAQTSNSNTTDTISATALSPEIIPSAIVQPTPTSISVPEAAGTIWVEVISPQDEAVVNTPQLDVIGHAPAGAVVSINDDILLVSNDQQFKTTLSLEEGPNLIEILASDENGNETALILTVTYEP